MNAQTTNVDQLAAMNQVVRLLWRHGYSLQDLGTSVTVQDPVHQVAGGGRLIVCDHHLVVIRSLAEARRFVDARS